MNVKQQLKKLGPNPEITRFKGLGEISPDEFKHFIGASMRLDPVLLRKGQSIKEMLEFYMGKNTLERQKFIIKKPQTQRNNAREHSVKNAPLVKYNLIKPAFFSQFALHEAPPLCWTVGFIKLISIQFHFQEIKSSAAIPSANNLPWSKKINFWFFWRINPRSNDFFKE